MDGNRRFAKTKQMQASDGHKAGFSKLKQVISWCIDLEITYLTLYAFSIENFKRNKDEVQQLLNLFNFAFNGLYQSRELLNKRGIAIKVIGNLKLLPKSTSQKIARTVLATKDNTKLVVTFAISYTSREEITNAIKTINRGVKTGKIKKKDISDKLIERSLYTENLPEVDFMVRTSGERRLSDFLLWQSITSVMYFTKVPWPAISFWGFISGIIYYQYYRADMEKVREELRNDKVSDLTPKAKSFLTNLYKERTKEFIKLRNKS